MNNVTNYRHENITETSRIWPSPYRDGSFKWANRNGEGESDSFDAAAHEAEEALIFGDILSRLEEQNDVVHEAFLADTEDGQTTLEIRLWRGFDLHDLSVSIKPLEVRAEGDGEYGRAYSLVRA
jgi:hypothetical protein